MAATEPTARRQAPSLGEVVGRLIGEARQLVGDYAELTILDARRAERPAGERCVAARP